MADSGGHPLVDAFMAGTISVDELDEQLIALQERADTALSPGHVFTSCKCYRRMDGLVHPITQDQEETE